jgi:TolB-like protein/Tfp pilus assembly protein PilF
MIAMTSLIPGYEYDIFISYRQKDNKGDKWVSEFVESLKTELESTFKEDVRVYFDNNPHDGLLETYDVDASLKDKLKCLIFIPIISRTYCDPRSFAWEHEFKAFIKQASEDKFGLKVKLPNGNVASRILPIRIHDLDEDDIKLCESVLDGVLRGIDFIYKEPGVDRPLAASDDERKNLYNTKYRNQVNKVALAIKEIISAINKQSHHYDEEVQQDAFNSKAEQKSDLKLSILTASGLILTLLLIGFFAIARRSGSSGAIEKSIAVLPFINDSPNDSTTYFINGVMEEILTNLQTIKDLRVISRNSVEQFRNQNRPSTPEIANKLGVNYLVEGSGQKYGNKFRLRVQLIRTAKENHLWAKSYEQSINETNDIFSVQSQIAEAIAKELKAVITPQEENLIWQKPTEDTLAYDYYLKGKQFVSGLRYDLAIEMYSKAIDKDPGFALAMLARADLYSRIFLTRGIEYKYYGNWKGFDSLAKKDLDRASRLNPNLPEVKFEKAVQLYSFERNYDKALGLLGEVETQMTNNPLFFYRRGAVYRRMGKWEQSLSDWRKTVQLDPLNASGYIELGHTYRLMRKYPEALEFFNKSLLLDQNPENIQGKLNTVLMWKGNLEEAMKYQETDLLDPELFRALAFYYTRHFENLLSLAQKYEDQFSYIPRTLNIAQTYFMMGKTALSGQYADSALPELKEKIKEFPEDDRYYAALGYAYAYKGMTRKAIENAQKAIKLKPIKMDAWQGYVKENDLARIYIITGNFELAMDKIEFLLSIPGELSVPLLKIDPAYDRLESLPRFQKILASEFITKY